MTEPATPWNRPLQLAAAALLLQALLLFIGGFIGGADPASPGNYVRYDGVHYLTIATDGYRIGYCGPGNKTLLPIEGAPRPGGLDVYCGNAGWFPGWSAPVAMLVKSGMNPYRAAVLCSWLFRALSLWLLAAWLVRQRVDGRATVATMTAAAAFPGSIYYLSAFPLGVTVLMLLLLIEGCRRETWLLAGLAAAYAAFSYGAGWLGPVGVGACLLWLAMERRQWRPFLLSAAVGGGALAGLLAVFAVMQWQTGQWRAYFLQQSIFEHHFGFANIAMHLGDSLRTVSTAPLALSSAKDWQTLVVLAWLLLTAGVVLRRYRQQQLPALLALAAAVASWIFPKMGGIEGSFSEVRFESMLLPLVCTLPQLPRPAQWLTAAVFVVLAPLTTAQFFLNQIV